MIRRLVTATESMRLSTRRLTKNQLTSARPISSATAQISARPMIARNSSRSPMSRPTSIQKPPGSRSTWTMAKWRGPSPRFRS